jgi:tetratricopeptide (TPR) repeat protein
MSRNSVFRYKGQEQDAQVVGRELGVRAVLTGRLLLRGDALTVSVELVDTADNSNLWGERYSRRLEDVITLEQEITRSITDELRIELTTEEETRLTKRHTNNSEAYRLCLRGRYRYDKLTIEDVNAAIDYFEQAIALDPEYAAAHAGLADAYMAFGSDLAVLPTQEVLPKAEQAALRALEIDDDFAEAHVSLGFIRFSDWDWATAEREYKRALELDPRSIFGHEMYSWYLANMGRLVEAIDDVKVAIDLEPMALNPNLNLAHFYVMAGRSADAISQVEDTMEVHAHHYLNWNLGYAYLQQSRFDEAIAEFEKVRTLSGNNPVVWDVLARAYVHAGRRDKALELLEKLEDRATRERVSPTVMAYVHASLGNLDQAFEWLETAYAERDYELVKLKMGVQFDPLRSDPRFQDLLQRMNFPE